MASQKNIFLSIKVARDYLFTRRLHFWVARFGRKELTDFFDFFSNLKEMLFRFESNKNLLRCKHFFFLNTIFEKKSIIGKPHDRFSLNFKRFSKILKDFRSTTKNK